jgi:hypothetical protein
LTLWTRVSGGIRRAWWRKYHTGQQIVGAGRDGEGGEARREKGGKRDTKDEKQN